MSLLDRTYLQETKRYLEGHSRDKYGNERDSRRSNLYSAEKEIQKGIDLPEVSDMQKYVDDMTSRAWWNRRFGSQSWISPTSSIKVKDGRRRKSAVAYSRLKEIRMPRHLRHERCVLHEVSHCVIPKPHPGHGRLFAKIFLVLVNWRMGEEVANNLKEAYRKHNVKWYPHNEVQV